MKHGFFTTLLNPSDSHCNDSDCCHNVMKFKGQAAVSYESGIQNLVPRHNKCLENAGDYVENKVMYTQFIHSVVFVN